MKTLITPIVAGAIVALLSGVAAATTLADVKARGVVRCGVNLGLAGFAARDSTGNWNGFDVNYCRAIAAAALGDPQSVEFTPLTTTDRFDALRSGNIDVLVRNTTWNMSREASLGLAFGLVNYYDGQGFMVRRADGFTSALDLTGTSVCVARGTTSEANLITYFEQNKMKLTHWCSMTARPRLRRTKPASATPTPPIPPAFIRRASRSPSRTITLFYLRRSRRSRLGRSCARR